MPAFIEFKRATDQNGDHIIVHRADGRRIGVTVSPMLKSSVAFGKPVSSLAASLNFFVAGAARDLPELSPEGFKNRLRGQLDPIARDFKTLQQAAQSQRTDTATKRAHFSEPPVPLDQRAAEWRTVLRSMNTADAAKLAMSNSAVAAAVLDAAPELSGLSPALVQPIADTYILARLTEHFANIHSLKPSVNDLLASGSDLEGARMYAEDTIKAWNAADNEVDDVKFLLENVIDFVAVTADSQRDGAYQLLTSSDPA